MYCVLVWQKCQIVAKKYFNTNVFSISLFFMIMMHLIKKKTKVRSNLIIIFLEYQTIKLVHDESMKKKCTTVCIV